MVGHRFVEALRGARQRRALAGHRARRGAAPAYDRVGLTSYIERLGPRPCWRCPATTTPDDELVELLLNDRGSPRSTAPASRCSPPTAQRIGYDALVLATGSYPFVPPVPGHDLPGCFVYRTLDDLDAIRAAADARGSRRTGRRGDRRRAARPGGRQRAAPARACEPHVVEMAPRLMPLQVDEGGGALLGRMIDELGITVHIGVGTERHRASRPVGRFADADRYVL